MAQIRLNQMFTVLLGLIAVSLFILLTDGDRFVSALAYSAENGWTATDINLWQFIYTWAPLPAWVLCGVAIVVLLLGYRLRPLKRYRKEAIFYILLILLGPGLLVNVLLKDNLGRARPREIVEFQGQYQHSQPWQSGEAGSNSSFPSGHASIAFTLLGPWFIVRRRKDRFAKPLLVGACGWGMLVGGTRILQGGHFLSDVLWAGGLVYVTGEVLALWLLPEDDGGRGALEEKPGLIPLNQLAVPGQG